MKKLVSMSALVAAAAFASNASGGVIAQENATATDAHAWTIKRDGTAATSGDVDVYPSSWSVRPGESIALRVRSTAGYTAKVFRMGWYGGGGAKLVAEQSGEADPQPYPAPEGEDYVRYGLLRAGWHDSLQLDTTGWLPGMYWVRLDQEGTGKQAATYFVVREPAGQRWPLLVLMPINTEQAYNAWPGRDRGGKSFYAWNSSPSWPTETIGMAQAVKVSLERPFLVGAGTGDYTNYQYAVVRWLERQPDYDPSYATDVDLDADPTLLEGRKAVLIVGHSEYWSRGMYDAAIAARSSGVSILSLSGDTLNWQVRYEDDRKTLVGFKESADNACPRDIDGCADKRNDGSCALPLGDCTHAYSKDSTKDPEAVIAHDLLLAGNVEEAKKHFELVTTHWNTLFASKEAGIDTRRPGIYLTGVQTAGIIESPERWGYPWCDYVISGGKDWWLYEGVDCGRVPGVGGYEIDSAATRDRYYDPWRPTEGKDGIEIGQKRIASLTPRWDGKVRCSAAYHRHQSGAEVIAVGAMGFAWALDDYGARQNGVKTSTESECAQRMIRNALDRWLAGAGVPPLPDAGAPDTGVTNEGAPITDDGGGCGCTLPGRPVRTAALVALGALGVVVVARRVRRRR